MVNRMVCDHHLSSTGWANSRAGRKLSVCVSVLTTLVQIMTATRRLVILQEDADIFVVTFL